MTTEPKELLSEDRQSLWMLVVSPAIWAAHFLLTYIGAAIWCGMVVERGGALGPIRAVVVGLAFVALIGIGMTGWFGWRRHSYGNAEAPHDKDTPADRHRFLGFATLLLSSLSGIALIYVVIATLAVKTCV